jgi:hypothetical protein
LQKRRDGAALQAVRNRWFALAVYHVWYAPRFARYALARGKAVAAPQGKMWVGNRAFRLVYRLFGIGVAARLRARLRHRVWEKAQDISHMAGASADLR